MSTTETGIARSRWRFLDYFVGFDAPTSIQVEKKPVAPEVP